MQLLPGRVTGRARNGRLFCFWAGPFVEVQAAPTLLGDAFLFCMVSADSALTPSGHVSGCCFYNLSDIFGMVFCQFGRFCGIWAPAGASAAMPGADAGQRRAGRAQDRLPGAEACRQGARPAARGRGCSKTPPRGRRAYAPCPYLTQGMPQQAQLQHTGMNPISQACLRKDGTVNSNTLTAITPTKDAS